MKTLTIDQRVFKHQDAQTKIKIALFEDDSRVSLDNDADYQFKIRNSSGYLKSETLTIEDNLLVLTTDKFKDLTPDTYSFEVWKNEDSIYPSENYGYFIITKNVSEVDGKTIPVITIENFEKRFDEAIKNNNNEIERKLSQISLVPEAFDNVDALKSKYPNGKTGIFITVDTGHKWFWVDGSWKDGGIYQTPAPIDDIREVDAKATQNSTKLKALLDNFTQEVDERKKADSSIVGYTFLGHLDEYGLPVLKIENEKISYLVNKQSGKLTDVSYSYNSVKNSIGINSIIEDGELSEIKVQGNSSVLYPKKNYTIKFKDAKCLKPEWGYHKKYVIKADWVDPSHLRNEFGAYMWYLLRKRKMTSDYELQNDNGETLTDNLGNNLSGETRVNFLGPRCGAIDSFPILVVINGVYHGLYSLTIPKDDWMAGMGSGKKEAIVSADKPSKATRFESLATVDAKGNLSGDDFEVEYVTDENNQSWVATSLNNMIQEVMSAENKSDITLLDVDSAIDYLIFCLYAENTDGFSKNFLLDTWDGNKWFVTAYDMDGTFGMMFDGKVMLSPWDYGINQIRTTNKLFDKLIKLFSQEIKDEWNKLHNSYLNESIIYYLISNKAKDIPQAAIDADRTRWPGLPGTTMNNLNQILQWISIRAQFLQKEFNTI